MREARCGQCGHGKSRCNCEKLPVPPQGGNKEVQKGRQETIEYLESVHTGSLYYYGYLFDGRWFALKIKGKP